MFRFNQTIIRELAVCASLKLQHWFSPSWFRASSIIKLKKTNQMHICFKIIKKFYYTLRCSKCFGHYCVHHQELSTTAHAASGYRVVLCWLRPPALFCCYYYYNIGVS
jgi:hypothetical protein